MFINPLSILNSLAFYGSAAEKVKNVSRRLSKSRQEPNTIKSAAKVESRQTVFGFARFVLGLLYWHEFAAAAPRGYHK
jgi:hypothetical protein